MTLTSEKASVAIAYIKLYQYEPAPAYTAPTDDELRQNAGAEPIRLQGENYAYTNSQTIFPTYDRGTYLTEDHTGKGALQHCWRRNMGHFRSEGNLGNGRAC